MTKRRKREIRLPGNDGRWFLELIGAEASPPHATTTLAQLASPDPEHVPAAEATTTSGGHGGILLGHEAGSDTTGLESTSAAAPKAADTGEFSMAPPAMQPHAADDAALGDWTPEELSRPLRSRRTVRWTAVAIGLLVVAALAVAVVWLPRAAEREAVLFATELADAMVELRNELPDAQQALADVTDPQSPSERLGAAIPATAELDTKANAVSGIASRPLPEGMPFLPDDPMDDLSATHQEMGFLGASAQQIATRIGRGFIYRTTMPEIIDPGTLPASVEEGVTVDSLSVDLAAELADSVDLVAALPADPAFDDLRQDAIGAVERFEDWIVDYLTTLRSGDAERVADLLAELDGIRADLTEGTAEALLVLRTDVDRQILELAEHLETAVAAIPF